MATLHPLIVQAKKKLPANTPAFEKEFAAHFFAKITGDDLGLMDVTTLWRTARLHFAMMQKRPTGKAAIRVHNPATETDGWPLNRTVIDFVDDDMAFQIDSITAEITRFGQTICLITHPLLHATSSRSGKITDIAAEPSEKTKPQSHIHIELTRMLPEDQCKSLQDNLERIANDVRYATGDWQQMRAKIRAAEASLSHAPPDFPDDAIEDYQAFLEYLYKDNFTLLGYREYAYETDKAGNTVAKTVKNSHLGLLRREVKTQIMPEGVDALPPHLSRLYHEKTLMRVFKLSRKSSVHRHVPMDAVMVRLFDKRGKICGEAVFVGLFTSVTYSRSIRDIPYLSRKTHLVMERSRFSGGTHGHKALSHILEKYPRDELFQIDVNTLYDYALSIMRLQERQRIALYTRVDEFGRYISCLVYIPRERYDTQLRVKIQTILEQALGGFCQDFHTTLDDSPLARVMFVISLKGSVPKFDRAAIEAQLQEAGRAWVEQINSALYTKLDDETEIATLTARYGNAFPMSYRESYEAKQCIHDIFQIERALADDELARDLYRPHGDEGHQLRLKVFRPGEPVILSDIMPILENMGLRVLSELPFEIKPAGLKSVWIHDFQMEVPEAKGKTPIPVEEISKTFEEALLRLRRGEVENDSLNRLLITAGMSWRDISILRAYVRYMRQGKTTYTTQYIEKALTDHSGIARMIAGLFHARLDPHTNRKKSDEQADQILIDIEAALNDVASLDQDRILRALTAIVKATLRTNFYQSLENGEPKPYLSFKLDSHEVPDLPEPRPFREIWVYSPRMEGIHLRADRIARGGIRWSDRNEDFRTEVLGLIKAQQVKNAVIVPMGAKGGFVLKKPPTEGGKSAFQQEGIECYKWLVRGLLDITDNRKGKKIIPPQNVVRRDSDDPYLVVAADKGTASFSDIANGLSADYDFWLGDAFASGGSVGYDHKKMGITARGAWESVKRHFRELGSDIQATPFDVIGVGDMAGDVFGNGMLLSRYIRLIGAFNHIHIFCDPNPDPETTFIERERLFNEVKGWDSYDLKKLSKGGRIYQRSEKSLTLTPEIMTRFGIEKDKVTPNELMHAMLKAETDLLWFGGIGTYIKASLEGHNDVGDKSNDSIRIDATEIRAHVIGEGANLGVTQRARIEFSRMGGRINADFIDNSGGVNSSDVEVNIKILMGDVINNAANKMDTKKRNILLAKMTEEVAGLVLRNSYQQAQGISLMTMQAHETFVNDAQFIRELERDQGLNRKLENLPDETEIEHRRLAGEGLLRPELCILQSYAKIGYTRELLKSDIPNQPEMKDFLISYFPRPLQDKYRTEILGHQLGREIIAMAVANSLVNRMGPTFIQARMDATGADLANVVRAFLVAREAFGLRAMWDRLEDLDGMVPASVQLQAMLDIRDTASRAVTWFLTRLGRAPKLATDIPAFRREVEKLHSNIDSILSPNLRALVQQRLDDALGAGLPKDIAHNVAVLPVLNSAFDIIRVALDRKTDITATARAYFEAGEYFHIDWLRNEAENIPATDRWSQESRDGLIDQLYSCQSDIAVRILADTVGKGSLDGIVEAWVRSHTGEASHITTLLGTIQSSGSLDISKLMIAVQRLRHLAGSA
jgi:glutamate dehydrogenase